MQSYCIAAIDRAQHRSDLWGTWFWRWCARCSARSRQREALSTLDDRLLEDIGVTRQQANAEAAKPFWKMTPLLADMLPAAMLGLFIAIPFGPICLMCVQRTLGIGHLVRDRQRHGCCGRPRTVQPPRPRQRKRIWPFSPSSRAEPPERRRSRGTLFVDAATNRSLHYASLRAAPCRDDGVFAAICDCPAGPRASGRQENWSSKMSGNWLFASDVVLLP